MMDGAARVGKRAACNGAECSVGNKEMVGEHAPFGVKCDAFGLEHGTFPTYGLAFPLTEEAAQTSVGCHDTMAGHGGGIRISPQGLSHGLRAAAADGLC